MNSDPLEVVVRTVNTGSDVLAVEWEWENMVEVVTTAPFGASAPRLVITVTNLTRGTERPECTELCPTCGGHGHIHPLVTPKPTQEEI